MKRSMEVYKTHKNQSGMALVLALLVVSVITAMAVELTWRFDLTIARSANRWHGTLATGYLEGAEAYAKVVLRWDGQNSDTDTLSETWALEAPEFPTDDGWVKGNLEDAQSRINLNMLMLKDGTEKNGPEYKRFTEYQRRFIRLLQTIELAEPESEEEEAVLLPKETAVEIAEAVIDWLDADSEVSGFGGAESDYYESLEPPYTIANGEMKSVSELNIIRGMTPELYQGLLPYVIVLPLSDEEGKGLNVNTLSLNLVRTLSNEKLLVPVLEEDGQQMLSDIQAEAEAEGEGIKDNEQLKTLPSFPTDQNNGVDTTGLVYKSKYFLFYGETMVGEHIRRSNSILFRDGDEVKTLRRSDANF